MSVRSQVQAMTNQVMHDASIIATPVTIDDLQGHVWSGSGLYWHFEQSVSAQGMPVMELSSTVEVSVSDMLAFYGGPPQQRWKITAVDITGTAVAGFINEVTPDLDLGRYTIRFGNP